MAAPPALQNSGTLSGWAQVWNSTDVSQATSIPPGGPTSAVQIHYHVCGTPNAPTLSQTTGSALPATTYYVRVAGVDSAGGLTLPSAEVSASVAAGGLLVVQLPAAQPDLASANVYVGTASGAETLQANVSQGSVWTEPASGLVAGAAMPTAATTTMCGAAHQDTNRWLAVAFNSSNGYSTGLGPNFYIRAWFYFQAPQPDSSGTAQIQRKMFYMWDQPIPNNTWGVLLTSFTYPGGVGLTPQIGTACGTPTVASQNFWDVFTLAYNTWYQVEFGVVPNSPGNSDGSLTVWINGTQVWQQTNLNIRGTASTGIGWVQIGDQADRTNFLPINEYRFISNIAIGTSYIP